MALSDAIRHIDEQILKLTQARAMLLGHEDTAAPKKSGRGRPKGSKNAKAAKATKSVGATPAVKGKRKLSPEGRKAIAEAMKRRWAERRKQPSK